MGYSLEVLSPSERSERFAALIGEDLQTELDNQSTDRDVVDGVPVDYLVKAPLTDTGNAECFAIEHGENYRYNKTNKSWYFWDEVVWKEDKTDGINTAILSTIRNRQRVISTYFTDEFDKKARVFNYLVKCEDVRNRKNIKQAAEWLPEFATTIDQYDSDIHLAATENGTLDLKDCSFRDSKQEDYLTKQLGTSFIESADCPRWKKFLDEVFNGDEELIDFMQRVIGYSLTGEILEQKIFILYGFGKNGKSVLLNTIQAMLGDYAGTASFKTFDADKQSEQTNDLAMLKGRRFVAMSESAADRRINEPLIKQVTGGDKISCRFLRKEFFEYLPQFKLFLATNHKPVITQSDFGIWRRIVLVPFTQNFDGREEAGLKEKLLDELPGILNWAIEGLRKWREKGLEHLPAAVTEATTKYKEDSDTVGQWLEQKTTENPTAIIRSSEAYNSYKTWAEENGYHYLGIKTFKSSLEERGFNWSRKKTGSYFYGLTMSFKI
ncbi:MAG: phage/plasmid primase, P4 family [Acidobacteria bacterium]|nr:phage/plasmid primase, P4 family [Acidobacteriota bacterium]